MVYASSGSSKLIGREVPNVVLGQEGRLGWTSWIGEKPQEAVTDDVVLRPAELQVGYNQDVRDKKQAA